MSAEQDVIEIWADLGKPRVIPASMFDSLSKMEAQRARKALGITTFQQSDGKGGSRWFWELDSLVDAEEEDDVEVVGVVAVEPEPEVEPVEPPRKLTTAEMNAEAAKKNREDEVYGRNIKPMGLSADVSWVNTYGQATVVFGHEGEKKPAPKGYIQSPSGGYLPTTFDEWGTY